MCPHPRRPAQPQVPAYADHAADVQRAGDAARAVPNQPNDPSRRGGVGRRIARNAIWLTLATLLANVLNVLATVLLARRLEVSAFGAWSVLFAAGSWVTLVRSGLSAELTRRAAHSPTTANAAVSPAVVLMLGGSVIVGAVAIGAAAVIARPTAVLSAATLLVGALIIMNLVSIPTAIFAGRDRMEWGFAETLQSLLMVVLIVVWPRLRIESAATAYLIAAAVVAVPSLTLAARVLRSTGGRNLLRQTGVLFSRSVGLMAATGLFLLYWAIDLYLLNLLTDQTQVGLYSAAFRLITLVRLPVVVVLQSVTPELVRRAADGDRVGLNVAWSELMRVLGLVTGASTVVLVALASPIITVAYSNRYAAAVPLLVLLSGALIPVAFQWIGYSMLYYLDHPRAMISGMVLALTIQVATSWIGVPRFGPVSTAVGFSLGAWAMTALYGWRAARELGLPHLWPVVAVGVATVGAVGLVLGGASLLMIAEWWLLVPGLALYLALCATLRAVTRADIVLSHHHLKRLIRM